MDNDPLGVDPETMRRLGYQTVNWLVERASGRCDARTHEKRAGFEHDPFQRLCDPLERVSGEDVEDRDLAEQRDLDHRDPGMLVDAEQHEMGDYY